ncbi:hypothetical protein BDV38DRAFT_266895 [Aspergillus pseudotamarii]|uniref:Protein kinase domain-containing protein n=1 Tax=Aspergillus pseudotamarii TaxID=132259 RepID=A0A5N6TBR6_ASPPS|nr:uncharacterized protein BDV38DRAFT_266895 [Aspergillus pseudotamarii]KAE8143742.1 hypothetical protein BDV38DRAFT_266895 [Aspergillus pseudotamarii]
MGFTIHDIAFIKCEKESETSSIFQVSLRGRLCIMKVYHSLEKRPWDPTYREIDPFICEHAAYTRLKERGLCEQGILPDFYASPTRAILLEYVSNMQKIDITTYTEDRAATLIQTLRKIHEARVHHGDPYPRNMMVQLETGRVLWIDFDRSQTFPTGPIADRQHGWMEDDTIMTVDLLGRLGQDMKAGRLDQAYSYYYYGAP